jgi:hypothetical protein
MEGVTISIKEMEYERLKAVLENLKGLAETVEENEDSVIADYRYIAEDAKRDIINTLLELNL